MEKEQVVAIGALGGSGTRVVAKLVSELGVYIGSDLNNAYDNLVFTRLFKNPTWFEKASYYSRKRRMSLFQKHMRGVPISLMDKVLFVHACFQNRLINTSWTDLNRVFKNDRSIKENFWGWKEPNTHILIEDLSCFFDGLKYIHVIRHGLDMAFSKNIQQLTNWGHRYGIDFDPHRDKNLTPIKQLDYWIEANRASISIGERLFGDDFLLVNFEELGEEPFKSTKRIADFLGLDMANLKELPKKSSSTGRYKKFDISIFSREQIEAVKSLGFEI